MPDDSKETLEMPITTEELNAAVFEETAKISHGRAGVGLEFFNVLWEDIAGDMRTLFTQKLWDRQLKASQKQGVIVCIAKNARSHTP